MPKINQEEYEVLKGLDERWKWIARDKDGTLVMGAGKNERYLDGWFPPVNVGDSLVVDETNAVKDVSEYGNLFQFIQWEDEEPYNIAELIREYEWAQLNEKYPPVRESEEREVKKDKEWLLDEIERITDEYSNQSFFTNFARYMISEIEEAVYQLDEPEVLSQEWIDEHSYNVHLLGTPDVETVAIPRDDLQNLLVPKQEEIKVSKMWHDVIAQNKEEGHSLRWTLNCIDNLNVNDVDGFAKAWLAYPNIKVEEEQKYLLKHNGEYLKSVKVQTYHNRESLDELGIHLSYTVKEYAQIFTKEQKEHIEKYLNVEVEELEE